MATKKSNAKQNWQPVASDRTNDSMAANSIGERSQPQQSAKRYDIVDPKRVFQTLEKVGLPTDGTEQERTDRLSSYYVHEGQKKTISLADCQPDDADDPQGCAFLSDAALDECPFCGKGGEVVVAPKPPPPADRDIELNVKAAAVKKEEKKPEAVKVTSKTVKEKKKARGETVEPSSDAAPDTSKSTATNAAIEPAKPVVIANDLPSESAGGTAADLDRLASEIDGVMEGMLYQQALSMWQIGKKLTEIRDKKLWSTVRNDGDGGYAYVNFNSFVAQRFDFTPDHAMLMIRISANMTEDQAKIGSAKAKAILDAKLPDDVTSELIAFASESDGKGGFVHSLVELRRKISDLKNPQLPAPATTRDLSDSSDGDDEDDDLDEDDDDDIDEDDDDSDDDPKSSKPVEKPAAKPPQMTSVSFESKSFSVPLAIKGSQIKPAKKISDEPHGTLQTPGGTKIHFKIVIGEDGQLFVEGSVDTPY